MQNMTLMNQNSELSILIKAFFHQDIALYFDINMVQEDSKQYKERE